MVMVLCTAVVVSHLGGGVTLLIICSTTKQRHIAWLPPPNLTMKGLATPPSSMLRVSTGNLWTERRYQAIGRLHPRRLFRVGPVAVPRHVRRDGGGERLQHMRGHEGADCKLIFPGSSADGVGHGGAAGVFRHNRRRRRELEVCCVFNILHNTIVADWGRNTGCP